MKLLTRYSSNASSSSLTLQQPIAVKRPPRLIRIPYYLLLVAIAAVYYGYVISVNIGFIGSKLGRTSLACTFLFVFHIFYGLMTWSLVVTANSGPGAVGEILLDSAGYDVERQRSRSSASLLPSDEVQLLAPFELTSTSTVDLHKGLGKRPNSRNGTRKQRFRSNSNVSTSSSDSDADRDDFDSMLKRLGEEGDNEEGKLIELIMPSTFNGLNLASMSRVLDDARLHSSSNSTLTAKANGRARFCRKCKLPKPDRAHHCSTCGFCVLKMDHHCPWIGGCVGFKNYKPFILFLLYADLLALFTAGTSLWALLQTMDMDIETLGLAPVGWGFLVLFGFLFSMMLSGFFPYHLYLTINNRTTIENMERNGRLLSLPARAESFVSAGTLEPSEASLPSYPKTDHAHRLSVSHDMHSTSLGAARDLDNANPFLPPQASATISLPSRAPSSNPLSRYQRRELERTAGKINMYDLGTASANFSEVFGADWTSWRAWLPIGIGKGTGYEYPVNKAKFARLQRINELLKGPSSGV